MNVDILLSSYIPVQLFFKYLINACKYCAAEVLLLALLTDQKEGDGILKTTTSPWLDTTGCRGQLHMQEQFLLRTSQWQQEIILYLEIFAYIEVDERLDSSFSLGLHIQFIITRNLNTQNSLLLPKLGQLDILPFSFTMYYPLSSPIASISFCASG